MRKGGAVATGDIEAISVGADAFWMISVETPSARLRDDKENTTALSGTIISNVTSAVTFSEVSAARYPGTSPKAAEVLSSL